MHERIAIRVGDDTFYLTLIEENLWRVEPHHKIRYGVDGSKLCFIRLGKKRILREGSKLLSQTIVELSRFDGHNYVRLS